MISVSGDGGFLYACGELATAAQERIPLTAVVVDDGGYGMLRFDQDLHGDPHVGVDLVSPDFAAMAGSFGVRSHTSEGFGGDFAAALARHVGAGRAVAAGHERGDGPAAERVAALVPGYSLKPGSPLSSATSIWAFWSLPA